MKKTGKKRFLSLALVLCMVLSMLPVTGLAASPSDVTVSGVSGVTTEVLPADIPAGYRAYCVYDIRLPQGTASDVTVSIAADDSFDTTLPVVVLDTLTGQIHSRTLQNGSVSFTTSHSGAFVLAQADVKPVSNSGVIYTLSQVADSSQLVQGAAYIISDYSKNWVLTNYGTTVSGKTYAGLQLSGTPNANTPYIWYINAEGYLVYGSPSATKYLLVGLNASNEPYTTIGALTDTNADDRCAPHSSSPNADDMAIYNVAGTGYLNRWGGGNTDMVATRYSSAGGSYWHMHRRVETPVTVKAVPSLNHMPVSATARVYPSVELGGVPAENYTIRWQSSDPAIATVSEDGLVMPTAPGRFVISGTVTEANGNPLVMPVTVSIPMSAYAASRTSSEAQATGFTAHTNQLVTDLTAGTASGPYIITNPSVNPLSCLSGRGLVTSKYCTGLEILPGDDGTQLWYFDGKYLRYLTADGPYLAYENNQVVLSTDASNAFDDIHLFDSSNANADAYIIRKSDLTGYSCLNQLGGSGYYAAGLYSEYSGSRWRFNQVNPGREVTLRLTPRTSTLTLGKSLRLLPTVMLDGEATSDYTVTWTSQNTAVATVNDGLVTPVGLGTAVITATVTRAGGQDVCIRVEMPLTVVKTTTSATGATAEAVLPPDWEPVTGALPTNAVTGPYRITNRGSGYTVTGTQGVTNSVCTAGGLEMIPYVYGDCANLWYYDGSGLLYGDPNATDRYMVYENGQVGLGPNDDITFNEIYLTNYYAPSFSITNAKLSGKKYVNQLGGGIHNAASVWSEDGDKTAASGWYFHTLGQEKQVVLQVNASRTALLLHESAELTTSLKVNGQTLNLSDYTVTCTSSDETVVKISNHQLVPQNGGTAAITATLKKISGINTGIPLSVSIPITVYGVNSLAVDSKSGTVMIDDEGSTTVGATISITYSNGTTYTVPVTVNHLQNADGSAVSTATAGTFQNLKVVYGSQTVCTDFTLTVRDGIPAEGTVYADKSVTGVNFFSTRVAQVELKVGGINGEQGTAAGTAAYLLDTLGNYFTMQTATTGRITPTMQIQSYSLYSLKDFQNGLCSLTQVGSRKGSAAAVETITFSADGTKAYSSLSGSTNIMSSGVISASNFWYNTNATASFVNDNGTSRAIPAKTLRWKVGTLSDTELVLTYYIAIEAGKTPGTYPIGRYTDLYYIDAAAADQRVTVASPSIYYEEGEEEIIIPTLNPAYASLSFEDEVLYNVYFTVTDQGSVTLADMGLITFDSKLTEGTVANCTGRYPGAVNKDGMLMVQSGGIPAKKLGDTLYFKIYARLSDGTYVYSNILGYSARQYAKKQLEGSDTRLKQLVVAMVTYGAAAQNTFDYNTDNLLSNILTEEHRTLVSDYNATMVPSTSVDSSKTGNFSNRVGFSKKYATVSFDSAFALNYYFTPDNTPDGNVTMYYWSQADYQKLSTLTTANATKQIAMTKTASGEYTAAITGIAAKELGDAVYVAVVCTSGGQSYCSGVIGYSVGVYCKSFAGNSASNMYVIGKATIVYGYYAKNYFNAL